VAIAFMVVFALAVLSIRNYQLYQAPLGFNYDNMWRVYVSNQSGWQPERDQRLVRQLLTSLAQQPEVESANLMSSPTFRDWAWTSSYETDGKLLSFMANRIDDGAAETFGLELVQGRWFGPQDEGQNYDPVLVSQLFVERYFPTENIVGKNIASTEVENPKEQRVVGVFKEFRQIGEFSRLQPYLFYREVLNGENTRPISGLELKLKAGTSVGFEPKLQQLLKGVAPQWEYNIRSWASERESHLRDSLLPLAVFAIIGSFLLFMVAMGLFGVLWQNVTSRTSEIGLRRAIGATAKQIHRQIVGELLLICLVGIFIALAVLVQFPMLGVFSELDWSLFFQSVFVATLFMLVLAALCAFYPGKIATQYAPAQALHYE